MFAPWFSRLTPATTRPADRKASRRRSRPSLELMEARQLLTTLVIPVTSAGDNGDNSSPLANSLRSAIVQANKAAAGTSVEIDFKLTNGGPQTISLAAPLPSLTHQVFLNGTTESGYAGTPLVGLDGTSAGGGVVGLDFLAGASNSTVSGIEVDSFNGGGVLIDGAHGVTLANDYIGVHTLSTGGALRYPVGHGNGTFGVELIDGASGNTLIGDVVSSNQYNGIVIGSGSSSNTVSYSKIGTDPTGTLPDQNNGISFGNGIAGGGGSGVVINGASKNNTLSNDVIADNHDWGVLITDSGTNGNVLVSDEIGTDIHGTTAMGNHYGVTITNGAQSNVIGKAGQGDVISGNGWDGVQLLGSGTDYNVVQSDKIGTNAAGTAAIPNVGNGVAFASGSQQNTVSNDVISGNTHDGVYISNSGTEFNIISGDLIGTSADGEHALGNGIGVELLAGASYNVIGGPSSLPGYRDVISGNVGDGVDIYGSGTNDNIVEGDYIGTDAKGANYLTNAGRGVAIYQGASSNIIGGTSSAYRDIISGNGQDGVLVSDSGTSNNTVQYDYIGSDATGEFAISDRGNGVTVQNGAYSTNVVNDQISGNLLDGVLVQDAGTLYTSVNYDWIGLDATGTRAVKNSSGLVSNNFGVVITNGAYYNSASSDVISGNTEGVMLTNGAWGNWVNNDRIGTNVAGTAGVANTDAGIFLNGVTGDQFVNDLICFNKGNGVFGEGGSNDQTDTIQATFTVTVGGMTYTNGQNPMDFC